MDEVAEKIGMDRLEFRIKNATKTDDPMPNDLKFNKIGLTELLEQVKRHPSWTDPLAKPLSGGKVCFTMLRHDSLRG